MTTVAAEPQSASAGVIEEVGVKVYKTRSADLIAGGVAATIDIATSQPLDYEGEDFVIRGGPVYYDGGSDIPGHDPWGYRASGSYVYKASERFGVVVGLTAQQQKNGCPSFTGWGYNDSTMRPPQGASDFTGDRRIGAGSEHVLSTKLRHPAALPGETISPTNRCACTVTTNPTASAVTTSTAAVISST